MAFEFLEHLLHAIIFPFDILVIEFLRAVRVRLEPLGETQPLVPGVSALLWPQKNTSNGCRRDRWMSRLAPNTGVARRWE